MPAARPPGLLGTLAKPVLLVAGLLAAGFLLRNLPMHDFARRTGHLGRIGFLATAAAACAAGLPRQIVAFAAGYAQGPWRGTILAMLAQILGCAADFCWARLVARTWVRARLAGRFGLRLARLDALLAAHPFTATLTLRLLPVGNNLALNLLAGGVGLPAGAFLAASAIGYLPQTAVFALLGSGIKLNHATQLSLGAVLFALSVILGLWLLRRARADGTV